MGAAEICCSVRFTAHNNVVYRAVEIARPTTQAHLTLTVDKEEGGRMTRTSREIIAQLDKGSRIFMGPMAMSFETPSQVSPVPQGWLVS